MHKNNIDDNELSDMLKPRGTFSHQSIAHKHSFYLSGEIKNPEFYSDWFHIIRNANELDEIHVYVNSGGGDLSTAIQFISVMEESNAIVNMHAEGECMSAATMIFLSGDTFDIMPHTIFMFHNYTSGIIGKGGELYDRIDFERRWSENLLKEVYKNFLTDKEIEDILNNKDLWMTHSDVHDRLISRQTSYKKEFEKKQKEAQRVNSEIEKILKGSEEKRKK